MAMTQPTHTGIGEAIRARRVARGLSIRQAAARAGIEPSTLSRIERNLRRADNRFMLADIAGALGCSVADLSGQPSTANDPVLAAAEAMVPAIRQALMETALDEPADRAAPAVGQLDAAVSLARDLYRRQDLAGLTRLLPNLLFELHAGAHNGHAEHALKHSVQVHLITMASLKHLGHPAESWIAAEHGRSAARALEDPVALAVSEFGRTCAATAMDGYKRSHTIAVRALDALQGHLSTPAAMAAYGLLTLRRGFSAAGLRQPDSAAEAFTEAGVIAQRTGETRAWDMFFGPTNVAVWQVGVHTDQGDPGLAVQLARGVNVGVFDAPVRTSAFYMDFSRALSHVRRDKDAIRMLLSAERLAPTRTYCAPMAREAALTLLERHGGPEIRGFAERAGLE